MTNSPNIYEYETTTRPKASGSSSRFQGGGRGNIRDKTVTRQSQDKEKTGTRQKQDRDKSETIQGQDKEKTGTR